MEAASFADLCPIEEEFMNPTKKAMPTLTSMSTKKVKNKKMNIQIYMKKPEKGKTTG